MLNQAWSLRHFGRNSSYILLNTSINTFFGASGLPNFVQSGAINFCTTLVLASDLTHGPGTNSTLVNVIVGGDCWQYICLSRQFQKRVINAKPINMETTRSPKG